MVNVGYNAEIPDKLGIHIKYSYTSRFMTNIKAFGNIKDFLNQLFHTGVSYFNLFGHGYFSGEKFLVFAPSRKQCPNKLKYETPVWM